MNIALLDADRGAYLSDCLDHEILIPTAPHCRELYGYIVVFFFYQYFPCQRKTDVTMKAQDPQYLSLSLTPKVITPLITQYEIVLLLR